MWCPNCRADVAAEVTADNRRVLCAACGSALENSPALRAAAKTREARELLERWSSGSVFDPYGPTAAKDPAATTRLPGAPPRPVSPADRLGTDAPAAALPVRTDENIAEPDAGTIRAPATAKSNGPRFDSAGHLPDSSTRRLDGPHAEFRDAAREPKSSWQANERPRRSGATALAGQLLAYGGVLGLTVGTTMVIWGYFGGAAHVAPTGWLVNTVGQMLLFLGVVTLVSGGSEATTDEVARRLAEFSERLDELDQLIRRTADNDGGETGRIGQPAHSTRAAELRSAGRAAHPDADALWGSRAA